MYCIAYLRANIGFVEIRKIFNDIIGTKIQKYYQIFNKKNLFSITFDENTAKNVIEMKQNQSIKPFRIWKTIL